MHCITLFVSLICGFYFFLGRAFSHRKNMRFMVMRQITNEKLTVQPIKTVSGELTLPGSKSLSNRVLLLSALSKGTTKIENLLESADIRYMLEALKQLKISVVEDLEKRTVIITGCAGPINVEKEVLDLGNAGTAMRPLTAALCAGTGRFILDGTARMRERPIVDLVDGLKQLGVDIKCSETGCPPVSIEAKGMAGGVSNISGKISSQYLSALLMAGPLSKKGLTLNIIDELTSAPYVHMTMNLMKKFGATVTSENDLVFQVSSG